MKQAARDMQLGSVTPEKARRMSEGEGCSEEEARDLIDEAIRATMAEREDDPYNHGYEPPIWLVVNALMQNPVVTDSMRATVKARCGLNWEDFAEKMRLACGFEHPVREVLMMGANRSGKTDLASKIVVRQVCLHPNFAVAVGAQSIQSSAQTQQARVWHYFPSEIKQCNGRKEDVLYISYKAKNGFSGNSFMLENHSGIRFLSYEQASANVLEGQAYHYIYLDEEFDVEWLSAARGRLASTGGTLLLGFTPVQGYTPVVANFLEGATITRQSVAYLFPKDGGPALPWLQLGLSKEEYETLEMHYRGKREDCPVPESRPEDCFAWLDTPPCSEPVNEAPDRVFDLVPRVARTKDGKGAILWFLGRDNPYGRPHEVIDAAMHNNNATEMIKKRVYGLAVRLAGRRFPNFTPAIHVCEPEDVPKHLARTFSCDPANERNWFFMWSGIDADGDIWVYREWPGADDIPGIGVPGPWAEISDKKNGINDGARGDGQDKFGFGFMRYKYELARLEGWQDCEEWSAANSGIPSAAEMADWRRWNGTREPLRRRVIDGRAGNQSKIGGGEDKTLIEWCEEIDPGWDHASGARITAGEAIINMLLDTTSRGQKLHISRRCQNLIFALSYYTGADGQKGACKEPLDCLRYALESGMMSDRPDEDDLPGEDGVPPALGPSDSDTAEVDIDWE